jgi:hypothetical protein
MEGANYMQELDYEAGRYKKKQTEKFFSAAPSRKLETKMRAMKKNIRLFEKHHTQLDNDV